MHDTSVSVEFLRHWSNDQWVLVAIPPDGGATQTRSFGPESEAEARAWIEEWQGQRNLYFTVNPIREALSKKPKREDVAALAWLHVDIDPREGEDFGAERERIRKLLGEFTPPPTVIIDSGGGYQAFWRLEEPLPIANEAEADHAAAYNRQLEILFRADPCHNVDRIMRLPGTINIPGDRKLKKGRKARLAQLVEAHWERSYPLSQFTAAANVQSIGTRGSGRVRISGNLPRIDLETLPADVHVRVKALIVQGDDPEDPTRYPSRSEALFAVVCALVRAGVEDDVVASIILDPDFGISASVRDKPRPEQYAAAQIDKAHDAVIAPELRELNEEMAVVQVDAGGKCRVVREMYDPAMARTRLVRQSFEDVRNAYMNRLVETGRDKNDNPTFEPLGKWWLRHSRRRQYRSITFAPGGAEADVYNLWQGFACEAIPGECSLFLDHIWQNICAEEQEIYEYLLNWMARAVQHPDTQGEVAVVMRGVKGTGKSFFAKHFGWLFGRHFLQISNPKHLVGNFNAHLRDTVVLFGDEAFFAGDKQHESILKTLITEEFITIEAKGVDAEAARNYTHLLLASNSDWVVPAGGDERRFLMLDVRPDRAQDTDYFGRIRTQLRAGGYEALLHLLQTRDITNFNVRIAPKTSALREQQQRSFSPETQWWHQKLHSGRLLPTHDGWHQSVPTEALQQDYYAHMQTHGNFRKLTEALLGKFLSRVLPEGMPTTCQKIGEIQTLGSHGEALVERRRMRHYALPPLSTCRELFDKRMGGPYEWPEDEILPEETEERGLPY